MKEIKKVLILVMMLMVVTLSGNAFALDSEDVYYTNDHYVSFTKEEYDFVSKFYFDGYQKYMNQEDYNYMIDNDLMNGKIEIKEITDETNLLPRANTYYETGAKKIQLSSSCTTSCTLVINLTWTKSPNVRSYDLIGAYSPTSNNLKFVNSRIYYDGEVKTQVEYKQESKGVSATMKLPSSGEDIKVVMHLQANLGTRVYASYQHAKKTISLANSRKYSFNSGGYGHVFLFDEAVSDYYDAMGGVQMTLS
ncbi:MAG: hypothetical protein K2G03_07040 [Bacilli bacterium]|nr:hypothetical protein [Bacilli bacterium]